MSKTAKRFAPPPKTRKRRENGTGTLSRHVEKDGQGNPVPYDRDEKNRPLCKYTLRVRLDDGRVKCRNIAALDDDDAQVKAALAAADLRKEAVAAAVVANGEAKAIEWRTVNELADHFLAIKSASNSSTREGTVAGYRADFKRFIREDPIGVMRVVDVTPEHVDAWIARHAGPKAGKARTRQKRVILLGSVFRLAVNDGWRAASPVLKRHHVPVKKEGDHVGKIKGDQRVAKVLSAHELQQVIEQLDPDDPALRLLVIIAGRMGQRLRELTHLRLQDFEVHPDGSAFLRVASGFACSCRDCAPSGNLRLTKSGKARLVPVPPDLVARCQSHVEATEARFGAKAWFAPVWRAKARQRGRLGELRVPSVLSGTFATAAKAIGRDDVVFHDLRATAKTHLLMSGANHTAVDVALGHQLPGMSSVYVTLESQPSLLYRGVYPTWEPKLTVVKKVKTA